MKQMNYGYCNEIVNKYLMVAEKWVREFTNEFTNVYVCVIVFKCVWKMKLPLRTKIVILHLSTLLAMRIVNPIQSKTRQDKPVECKQIQKEGKILWCKWINENMQIE